MPISPRPTPPHLYDPPNAPAWPLRLAVLAGVSLFWGGLAAWLFS